VSAQGTVPCSSCGASIPIEHSRCSRCGAQALYGSLSRVETTPGAPLVRPRRTRRISSHDLVPTSLRQEYELIKKEKAARGTTSEFALRQKRLLAAVTGAALTGCPMAIPSVLFLPRRSDAFLLIIFDLLIGAFAGSLLLKVRGGLFQGLFIFGLGYCLSIWAKLRMGYPFEHNPVALAVLGSASALAALVACVVGVALDDHEDSF